MCGDGGVRLRAIYLRDFRNLASVRVVLGAEDPFFVGRNGQGKTALLEACSLLTALRSFRTADLKTVIRREGSGEAGLRFEIDHDQRGTTEVEIRLGGRGRALLIDGEPITRLRDMVGLFPTVAISSQDIQLLRGSPAERRRFLDLLVAGADPEYFESLRGYHQALRERNALLKRRAGASVLAAFEAVWCASAARVVARREEVVRELATNLQEVYGGFAPTVEAPSLRYRPDVAAEGVEAFREALEQNRERDTVLQTTTRGPHRDDLVLRLNDRSARDYGSEGQQRGVVIALKLAAVRWVRRQLGVAPVVLADDVLTELDGERREAFWGGLDADLQVLATGTEPPRGNRRSSWSFWRVEAGSVIPQENASLSSETEES